MGLHHWTVLEHNNFVPLGTELSINCQNQIAFTVFSRLACLDPSSSFNLFKQIYEFDYKQFKTVLQFSHAWPAWTYILPIVLFAILYNIPKLFELHVSVTFQFHFLIFAFWNPLFHLQSFSTTSQNSLSFMWVSESGQLVSWSELVHCTGQNFTTSPNSFRLCEDLQRGPETNPQPPSLLNTGNIIVTQTA